MERITRSALGLLALVSVSCSGTPTGPSATSLVDGGSAALNAPNQSYPGTGTNPGLNAPNSCTDGAPTITDIGSNAEFVKIAWNKVDGLTRGYRVRLTQREGAKRVLLFNTDGQEAGREFQLRDPKTTLAPGQWSAEVQARRVGCGSEFGTWSAAVGFYVVGDVDSSPKRRHGGY